MELILEIIIYLLVVLGLITVCFTFFNKSKFIDQIVLSREETIDDYLEKVTYMREKNEGEKIVLNVRYKNIPKDELDKIKESIKNGLYNDIMDIADEVNYIDASQRKNKKSKN